MEQTEQEEFSKTLGPEDQCDFNPEFAVICSFINRFGSLIDIQLDIEELKRGIENQDSLDDSLIDIHVRLLKKLRRYFVRDQWEKALIRFAFEYSYEHGHELETFGYLKSRPSIKLQLLRRLLDAQFECDPKFKASVNLIETNELKTSPTGRDIEGNTYWSCTDEQGNLRVYREEPLSYKSWITICKNPEDLKQLIEHLDATKENKIKGEPRSDPYDPYPEIFAEYFDKEDPDEIKLVKPLPVKKVTKKGGKKGKIKERQPQSEPLAPISELNETADSSGLSVNGCAGKYDTEPHHDRPRSTSPNASIESQVKYTIESILGKVCSSLDYIFRRNCPDVVKSEAVESVSSICRPEAKPRKRIPKREKAKVEELPRRSSSRIQQLQQKKIEEEATKQQILNEIKVKSVAESTVKQSNGERCNYRASRQDKKEQQRWRGKKGKKLSWDKDDSDLSSTSSLSDSNDESFMEALDGASQQDNDEDEFACEDEETNDEPVIIKRARTARQSLGLEETTDVNNSTILEEDKPCGRCDKSNDPDWILLCDMCDDGYHIHCCVPPLMYVPDGDWFCPPCEQKTLINNLKTICETIVELLAAKERERLKRQRLRQHAPKKDVVKTKPIEILTDKRQQDGPEEQVDVPVPVVDESSGSSLDELTSSYRERAIRSPKRKKPKKRTKRMRSESEEDDFELELDRRSKRKYSRNISESETEEEDLDDGWEEEEDLSETSSDESEQLKTRRARAFVSYKFEEYDELIQSAICGDSDGEVANRIERTDTEPCNIGRGKDMATIEALAYQQENGIDGGVSNPPRQAKPRRKGRKLNDLDAESEIDIATSDESFQASSATEDDIEDEEEDISTEVCTEDDSSIDEIVYMHKSKSGNRKHKSKKKRRYDDASDDSDFKPRSRRAAAQKVSYKESTDEEEEQEEPIVISEEPQPISESEPEPEPEPEPEQEQEIVPVLRNPINELSQYCDQSSHPSDPLFRSFKMSPPRPKFYKEDEVRSLPANIDE